MLRNSFEPCFEKISPQEREGAQRSIENQLLSVRWDLHGTNKRFLCFQVHRRGMIDCGETRGSTCENTRAQTPSQQTR